jgi:hypothetical protein
VIRNNLGIRSSGVTDDDTSFVSGGKIYAFVTHAQGTDEFEIRHAYHFGVFQTKSTIRQNEMDARGMFKKRLR